MSVPTVVLTGRPNVGKSALFNFLAGRKIAIVHDSPGVTRDRLTAPLCRGSHAAFVTDTGGVGGAVEDGFATAVQREAAVAAAAADIILFVCDCRESCTPADASLAAHLHRANVPVLLVLNKADSPHQELALGEFAALGFPKYVFTSAAHGRGLDALVAMLDTELAAISAPHREAAELSPSPAENDDELPARHTDLRLAVVGRPNAGKSSLINAVLRDRRTIVSDIAGTTRDAVDIPYTRAGVQYTLIDTAGLRPRSRRDTSTEVFAAMRSERAVRRADVCLLTVDASAGITHRDRCIAAMIAREKKPCIVVLNKFDLFFPDASPKARRDELRAMVREQLFFLEDPPFVPTSAVQGSGIGGIFAALERMREQAARIRLGTGELNRLLQHAMQVNPPPAARSGGRSLKLFYAAVASDEKYTLLPVPTYVLFVNDKRLLSDSYAQYLRSAVRARAGVSGVPVVLSPRSRVRRA